MAARRGCEWQSMVARFIGELRGIEVNSVIKWLKYSLAPGYQGTCLHELKCFQFNTNVVMFLR